MSFQLFYLTDPEYGEGLLLEKYNETFGIYEAGKSRTVKGTVFKKWAFPQRRVDGKNIPAEKAIPMGVKLGNQRDAIKALKYFLEQLNAG